jgi:uncharacterized protein YjiS (DUF1127 family)
MTMQRQIRNDLLAMSDWTQLPDVALSDAEKAEWSTYRQALRDLNVDGDDPTEPDWPTPPAS